ncbi:hypothetical protein K388_05882 [Streptomyces sp. KhCrAH-43]|nr:hypothetical protein K388_05882 [Streptomyces sp. KhCrAH-43]
MSAGHASTKPLDHRRPLAHIASELQQWRGERWRLADSKHPNKHENKHRTMRLDNHVNVCVDTHEVMESSKPYAMRFGLQASTLASSCCCLRLATQMQTRSFIPVSMHRSTRFVSQEETQVTPPVFKVVPTHASPHEQPLVCKQVHALVETHVLPLRRRSVAIHATMHAMACGDSHVRTHASAHAFYCVSREARWHASRFVYIKTELYGCVPETLVGDKFDDIHVCTNEVPRGLKLVESLASLNVGQLV